MLRYLPTAMDSTYWAILLGAAGIGLGLTAALAHLAARRAPLTLVLAATAAALLATSVSVGDHTPRANAATAGPADLSVKIAARMYEFQVDYGSGATSFSELVLPAGRTARLQLKSLDVAHSLWIPELGVRQTIVPGAPSELRVRPPKAGELRLLCGEFCGPNHAAMKGVVRILPPSEFEAWRAGRRAPGG